MGWHWGILASSGGGAAGAYELISTTVLTTTAASVTFSSIPSTYKHLQIRTVTRTNFSDNFVMDMTGKINNDSNANYSQHFLNGNGTSVTSGANTNLTYLYLQSASPAANTTANSFGCMVMELLDYSSTSKNKTIRAMIGAANPGSTYSGVRLISNLWMSTAAVTSVQLNGGGSFIAGSRFSLYGIKG